MFQASGAGEGTRTPNRLFGSGSIGGPCCLRESPCRRACSGPSSLPSPAGSAGHFGPKEVGKEVGGANGCASHAGLRSDAHLATHQGAAQKARQEVGHAGCPVSRRSRWAVVLRVTVPEQRRLGPPSSRRLSPGRGSPSRPSRGVPTGRAPPCLRRKRGGGGVREDGAPAPPAARGPCRGSPRFSAPQAQCEPVQKVLTAAPQLMVSSVG